MTLSIPPSLPPAPYAVGPHVELPDAWLERPLTPLEHRVLAVELEPGAEEVLAHARGRAGDVTALWLATSHRLLLVEWLRAGPATQAVLPDELLEVAVEPERTDDGVPIPGWSTLVLHTPGVWFVLGGVRTAAARRFARVAHDRLAGRRRAAGGAAPALAAGGR